MVPQTHASADVLGASIEVTPRQAAESADLPGLFPPGTRVYIADLGKDTDQIVVAGARRLHALGYVPVPHIAARRIVRRADLDARIGALAREAAVYDVLVVGGGVAKPRGEFASTMDLLDSGILEKHGITHIGVAGHPEGSPDMGEAAAISALCQKQEFGRRSGAEMRIVTQFCFDPAAILAWAAGLERHGIRLPVHVGIAGPANASTLIKYATMCGVGNSMSFLRKRVGSLTALTVRHSPDALVAPIEAAAFRDASLNIKQIHIFAFGGVRSAAEWLKNRGSWREAGIDAHRQVAR